MIHINENDNYNSGLGELFDKMVSVLRHRGFYDGKVRNPDPADFLSEQEQEVFADAIKLYRSIPF